jgi:hypothetical protein
VSVSDFESRRVYVDFGVVDGVVQDVKMADNGYLDYQKQQR